MCEWSLLFILLSRSWTSYGKAGKKKRKKMRGRLNDMIWLYCSACCERSSCLAPGKSPCLARGAEISRVDCAWHYITCLFNAFCSVLSDRQRRKRLSKNTQKWDLPERKKNTQTPFPPHKLWFLNWIHSGFLNPWWYRANHPTFIHVLSGTIVIKDASSTAQRKKTVVARWWRWVADRIDGHV